LHLSQLLQFLYFAFENENRNPLKRFKDRIKVFQIREFTGALLLGGYTMSREDQALKPLYIKIEN
jgi:hypothetical protein